MYTRTYNDDRRDILIPESYGGTTLFDNAKTSEVDNSGGERTSANTKNPWDESEDIHTSSTVNTDSSDSTETFLSKIPRPSFLSHIFKNDKLSLQNLGKEEILIIATAALLFFTKNGDKELAIMMLILLFL